MNFLLEVDPNATLDFISALSFGGQTTLIGMATVFGVLVIIWCALILFKLFLYDIPNKKKSPDTVVVTPAVREIVLEKKDDSEIIAVIAAAVATAEAESNGAKFRVVSFRRK